MWKLVLYAVFYLGATKSEVTASLTKRNHVQVEKNVLLASSSNQDISVSELLFSCNNRAPGYYADPRFSCELFHFCHSDGTRVSIPCFLENQKHRICLLKDIVKRACDGSELFISLPEDLTFKSTKDTTASALNSATEFKLPHILAEPTLSSESKTTPLPTEIGKPSKVKEVGGVYEVFNSFLKEIEASNLPDDKTKTENASFRLKPSTFSRRSHVPYSLELDPLINENRRSDANGAVLVEVYNDRDYGDGSDYRPYQRKAKKFQFSDSKKSSFKLPRRKRSVPSQFKATQPYAIVYAKVPDTTLASSSDIFQRNAQNRHQKENAIPFAPALVPSDVPVVPVTLEVRQRKKDRTQNNYQQQLKEPRTRGQIAAEQRNVYYYSPDESNVEDNRNVNPRGSARPQSLRPGEIEHRQGERLTNSQSNTRQNSPGQDRMLLYAPQVSNPLNLPNFPFQPQPFLNDIRQTSFFYPSPGVQEESVPSFGPQINRPSQYLRQPQSPESPPLENRRPIPTPEARQPRPHGGHEEQQTSERSALPQIEGPVQNFQGFQNPFFSNFPGYVHYNGLYSQPDVAPHGGFSPPHAQVLPPQFPPQQLVPREPPQHNVPERPRQPITERPQVHIRPNNGESGGQNPTRKPNVQSQELRNPERQPNGFIPDQVISPQPIQRPYRPRQYMPEQPPPPPPPIYQPNLNREIPYNQSPRQPTHNRDAPERNLRRPTPPVSHHQSYHPDIILERPEPIPPKPLRNREPVPGPNTISVRERNPNFLQPQNIDGANRNAYGHREESPPVRSNHEHSRRPESQRNTPPPVNIQTPFYRSPTPPPPSSRIRSQTRKPSNEDNRRPYPVKEDIEHDIVVEDQRAVRHQHIPSSPVEYTRTRTPIQNIPDSRRHRDQHSTRNRFPNDSENARRPSTSQVTRYQEMSVPRTRGSTRDQIERPPQNYVPANSLPDTFEPPRDYINPPPSNDVVDIISYNGETQNRQRQPESQINHPYNHRDHHNQGNPVISYTPESIVEFNPYTDKPLRETHSNTRLPNIEVVEVYRHPENIESNRYQYLDDEYHTTKQVTTTRAPKRRPPPPKPTFPAFPTFPPPPRRPITTPRAETPEEPLYKEAGDPTEDSEKSVLSSFGDTHPSEAYTESERSRSQDNVEANFYSTETPEVTTRRRTRKRRPRPRKPKPSEALTEDGLYIRETITEPTIETEISTRSTSSRSNSKWRQNSTNQPRRRTTTSYPETDTTTVSTKSEEYGSRINLFGRNRSRRPTVLQARSSPTTQSQPLLREESQRVTKTPTVLRSRKPYAKRVRVKTTTTTSTENPDTVESINRSDENEGMLNYQREETTVNSKESPQSETTTLAPVEIITETQTETESYNDLVQTTEYPSFLEGEDGVTEANLEGESKMSDFESRRSVNKKFQNRPRILKFGKPKLRTTISPIELNEADSRTA
ncbi:serine/arginine repetitive matrix protein 2-like [Parasteatoda tepidariorum]|uniref:serine/arginine repetitive matrix protein 2-like n=1 Tax=Parasteatoda tepidariorum TaxID=114398 RepID=UPI001C719AE4|nr:serine/arginine repetitive matrix protein 1-like [Parasteatoda tepidariorum]